MNVLVLGEQPAIRLLDLLRTHGMSGEHAISFQEAVAFARHGAFDVVLLDRPSMGGATDSVRALRAASGSKGGCSELPILAMLSDGYAGTSAQLLNLGADDVVAARCDFDELAARLRAVVRRSRGYARPFLSFGPLTLDPQTRQASIHDRPLAVTGKEFTVLETLVLRKGRVLSKTVLLDRIYDAADGPELRAIDVLVCRLRKKLQAAGAGGLINTAWGNGYSLREQGGDALQAAA